MPVTYVLIGLSVLATAAMRFDAMLPLVESLLISTYYAGLREIGDGEYWRLITPAFLHFGLMHIVFNMLWLWDLGGKIEKILGSLTLLAIFMLTAAISNVAQFFVSGPLFGGMSGVVYGLLGFVWMQSRYNPYFFYYLNKGVVLMMLIWYVVCLTGLVGNIANTAHTVGLLIGVIWGLIHAMYRKRRFRSGNFVE